jgi:ArsR family transcriptional regulator, arsenate/arsenite/antimonite-responsive transcriptional repressor
MNEIDYVAESFKALGDATRLRLLEILTRQEYTKKHCVGGLSRQLGISQPNVSHHLKILKSAGLVQCAKRDGFSYYVVNKSRLSELGGRINPDTLGANLQQDGENESG